MKDERREGDERPFEHTEGVSLTLRPAPGQPFRWLPRQGEPLCIGEWASQHVVRFFAYLPVYTAIIVTFVIIIQVLHPFGLGD